MTANELKRTFQGMRETDLTEFQKLALLVIGTDAGCELETVAMGCFENEAKTRPIVRVLIEKGLVHKPKQKGRKSHYLTDMGSNLIIAWLTGKTIKEMAKPLSANGKHDFSNATKKPFPGIPPLPPRP